jgi:hypothetical protein
MGSDSHEVGMTSSATRTASGLDTVAKDQSERVLSSEFSGLDLAKTRLTQPSLPQMKMLEDQCRCAWVPQVLEPHMCHFVDFIESTFRSSSHEARNENESIMEVLDLESSDSEEYDGEAITSEEYIISP